MKQNPTRQSSNKIRKRHVSIKSPSNGLISGNTFLGWKGRKPRKGTVSDTNPLAKADLTLQQSKLLPTSIFSEALGRPLPPPPGSSTTLHCLWLNASPSAKEN